MDNNAEFTSKSFVGWDAAYPTKQNIKHIKNIVPDAIPNASGLLSY